MIISTDYGLTQLDKEALMRLRVPIPSNENERIKTLRQSHILDSNEVDPSFDRFTSLCQRIFNVPISLVSLVDVNRQWFKSKIGLDVVQTDRNSAFCAYTVLPESPEVFVVPDAHSDERFSQNPLVTGSPFIRFYAGVALIVEGVRVGSLCIIDTNPRQVFSQEDKMNLLDFGSAVSSLIILQRNSLLSIHAQQAKKIKDDQKYIENNFMIDKNNLMVDMMHQVRTPLMSIQLNSSLVESIHLELTDYLREDSRGSELTNNLSASLSDLKSAISQLDTFVAASLKLTESRIQSDKIVDKNSDTIVEAKTPLVLSKFNDLLNMIQSSLSSLIMTMKVEWQIDDKLINSTVKSYPEIMKFILCFLMSKTLSYWNKANITINFKSYNDISNIGKNNSQKISTDNNNNVKSGYLSIMINISQPNDKIITNDMNHQNIDLKPIERILYEIGGDCRTFNFDASSSSSYFTSKNEIEEQFFEICLPCDLLLSDAEILSQSRIDSLTNIPNNNQPVVLSLPSSNDFIMKRQSSCYKRESGRTSTTIHETTIHTYEDDNNDNDNNNNNNNNNGRDPLLRFDTWEENKSQQEEDDSMMMNPNDIRHQERNNSNFNMEPTTTTTTTKGNPYSSFLLPALSLSLRSADAKVLRVLLVDDSAIIYKVMKKWLVAEGCEVTIAENGKIALSYLKTQQFDITLMDFIMPVMLGRDAMKLFQEWKLESCLNNINDDMLLVGMSANASQRDQQEAYQYGMHFFASKPVDLNFLSIVLAAKSKNISLPRVIQEITIKKSKSMDNSENGNNNNIDQLCIQKKKNRLKKYSTISGQYCSQQTSHSVGCTNLPDTEITAADVNLELSAKQSIPAANIRLTASLPTLSTTPPPSSESLSFIRRYRHQLYHHLFTHMPWCGSKINPTHNIATEE